MRAQTPNILGFSIHAYRQHLRLRASLCLLWEPTLDISDVARNWASQIVAIFHGVSLTLYRREARRGLCLSICCDGQNVVAMTSLSLLKTPARR